MVAVALVGCDSTWSIIFFILAMGFNGCCYPGFNSTHVDMAPDFAGTLMGLTNSFGNIPGFIAPLVAASFYNSGVGFVCKLNFYYDDHSIFDYHYSILSIIGPGFSICQQQFM